MTRAVQTLLQLIGILFFGIGLFGVLKNWLDTDLFSWVSLICLIFGAGIWRLSFALGPGAWLEQAASEEPEEKENGAPE